MNIKPSIYADYNSTSLIHEQVAEAMLPYLSKEFGNPSSLYSTAGARAFSAVESAREQVAHFLDADPEEVVFVSGGTESCFQAIMGVALWHVSHKRQMSFLSSAVEHQAVHQAIQTAQEFTGFPHQMYAVRGSGELDFEQPYRSESSLLVSIMGANNETGICFPLDKLAGIFQAPQVTFHSDLVQVAGKKPFSFRSSALDLASVSAHKIGGPKGIGALLIKKGASWTPPVPGGGQESGRRGGTLAVANIVGFGEAARISATVLMENNFESKIRDSFEQQLYQRLSDVDILGINSERLPNTSSMLLDSVDAVQLVDALARQGICISKGSACKSNEAGVSHVLAAMGVSERESRSQVRVSFGHQSTQDDADVLVEAIAREVEDQRELALSKVKYMLGRSA